MAGRPQPPERPVGPVPVRGVPHALPPLGRYAWWLLVPFVVAGLLRVAVTPWVSGHLGSGITARAIRHAHRPTWGTSCVIAALVSLVVMVVLALLLGLLSRRMWSILGGGALGTVQSEAGANDAARDAGPPPGRSGYAGLITAATFQSELTHLGRGLLRQRGRHRRGGGGAPRPARTAAGLPPEPAGELGGARDRGRAARQDAPGPQRAPSPNVLERVVSPGGNEPSLHPSLVASFPWASRGRPRPISARPTAGPAGCAVGPRPPSSSPASSTCSTPSPPPSGAGSTWCSSSSPCGPVWPPAPSSPWPVWLSWPWAGDPPRPAPGLAGGRRPPRRDHRPPPHRRRRRRGVAVRRGRAGTAPGQPAGLPGRVGLVLAAVGPGRPGRGRGRDHPADRGLHRAVHPHRPPSPLAHPVVDGLWAVSERLVGIQTVPLPQRADRFLAPPSWPSGSPSWPSPCSS